MVLGRRKHRWTWRRLWGFRVCIGRILKRNGVKVRSSKEANGGLIDEQEEEVWQRFLAGEKQNDLAKAYGKGTSTIHESERGNKWN